METSPRTPAALFAVVLALGACSADVRQAAAASKLGAPAYHALWVDAFREGIHSPDEIDQLVSTAHNANVNALFVQVRKNADAYYLDSLEPVASDISGPPGFDPLRYLLKRAHGQNPRIEVHAWVNTFYVGVRSPAFVYFGAGWGNRSSTGETGGYLDPGNRFARAYTHVVLMHLAQRYDLDGLHLDFVRYPEGGNWGYSQVAVDDFDAATVRSGDPDPSDPVWERWRRDQLTSFVRDLYLDLNHTKPRLKLSAALIPWGPGPISDSDWQETSAYNDVYQDWHDWLREGILDLAVPMNYDTAWNSRAALWFEQWIEWEKNNQFDRRVIIGVGAFFNYPEDTFIQIRQALAASALGNKAAGVAIYSYASTSLYGTSDYYDDPEAASTLPRQPYARGLDASARKARGDQYNRSFWRLLTAPGSYNDPAIGAIETKPVFTEQAAIPALPWKR